MNHIFVEMQLPTDCTINGKSPDWDQYFICLECSIVKVIRKTGNINFISKNGFKLFNGEPACLKIINEEK